MRQAISRYVLPTCFSWHAKLARKIYKFLVKMFYQMKIHLNVLVLNIFSFSSSSRIYILHWWVSDQPIKSRFSVLLIFSANLSKYCIFVQFQRKSFFKTAATVLQERALLIFIAFSTRLPHCWNKCRCLGHFTSRGTRTSEVYVDVMVGIWVNPGNIRRTDSERLLLEFHIQTWLRTTIILFFSESFCSLHGCCSLVHIVKSLLHKKVLS